MRCTVYGFYIFVTRLHKVSRSSLTHNVLLSYESTYHCQIFYSGCPTCIQEHLNEQLLCVHIMPGPERLSSHQERDDSSSYKTEKSPRLSSTIKQTFLIFIDTFLYHKLILLFLNYLCHLMLSVHYFIIFTFFNYDII